MKRAFQLGLCIVALLTLVLPLTSCRLEGLSSAAQVNSSCGHAMPATPSPRMPPCCVAHAVPRVALTARAHDWVSPPPVSAVVLPRTALPPLAPQHLRFAALRVVAPPGSFCPPLRI